MKNETVDELHEAQIKKLEKEIEGLKEQWRKALRVHTDEIRELEEWRDKLNEARSMDLEHGGDVIREIKSLQSEVERLGQDMADHHAWHISKLGENETAIDELKERVDCQRKQIDQISVLHSARLSKLEQTPNKDNRCPIGKDCVNNAGYFSGPDSFEECGHTCPVRAAEIVREAQRILKGTLGYLYEDQFQIVKQAVQIASDACKGESNG